jgi:hypothetical protein
VGRSALCDHPSLSGFGHWLGLVCPECGRRLPALANGVTWAVTAGVVLAYRVLDRPFEGGLLALRRGYLAWEWRRTSRALERIAPELAELAEV